MKLGQVIALLDLVVPHEYTNAMKPLLNNAPESDFKVVKSVIEEDLEKSIDEVFIEFDEIPLASASLAQVHRAKLRTGEEVAVKVQHKWIREQYPGDIDIMERLTKLGRMIFKDFDFLWVIEGLRESSHQELNFKIEAKNAIRCGQIFKNDPLVKVPKVHTKYSSGRVLTMELMTGVSISDIESIQKMGISLKDTAYTLSRAFNEMIFIHGFIHCDPHPGNIYVRPVRRWFRTRAQIIILDHGLYKELSKEKLKTYRSMWMNIIMQDEEGMKRSAEEMGVKSMYPLLAGMMVGRPWDDIMDTTVGLERLRNARGFENEKEALKIHAKTWFHEINQVLAKMDNEFILVFKTFEWLRSIDADLGADVNTIQIIADYITRDTSIFTRLWFKFKLYLYSIIAY